MRFIALVLVLVLMTSVQAAPPDIGNNTLFQCVETEIEPGLCFGDPSFVMNAKGVDKGGKIVGFGKARRLLKRFAKFYKKQARKAERQDDTAAADEFEALRQNAIQSREDLDLCFDHASNCDGGSGDDGSGDDGSGDGDDGSGDSSGPGNFPSTEQACSIAIAPTSSSSVQRKKFIVNGSICTSSASAASPIMKITSDGAQHCTGTLVAPLVVLSAAHCFEQGCENMQVENATGSQAINIASCINHPGFNQGAESQANDLALVFLAAEFDGIPTMKIATSSAAIGDDAVLAGYGLSENETDESLRATFNQISDITTEVISTLYNQGETNEGTTCSGDSGGALLTFIDGEWQVHGTLSDGSAFDCALPGTTPTSDTSNWANTTSESNQNFIKDNTEGILD